MVPNFFVAPSCCLPNMQIGDTEDVRAETTIGLCAMHHDGRLHCQTIDSLQPCGGKL